MLASMTVRLAATKRVIRTKTYDRDKLKEPDISKEYKEAMWNNIAFLVKGEMNTEETGDSMKNESTPAIIGLQSQNRNTEVHIDEMLQLSDKQGKLLQNKKERKKSSIQEVDQRDGGIERTEQVKNISK